MAALSHWESDATFWVGLLSLIHLRYDDRVNLIGWSLAEGSRLFSACARRQVF